MASYLQEEDAAPAASQPSLADQSSQLDTDRQVES